MYPIKYFLNTDYQAMEVLGVEGLFTNLRVERESLPEGFFKYSLREGEDDYFSSIEGSVWVNHSGDFICKKELPLGEDGFKEIDGDYGFTNEPVDLDRFFGVNIKMKVAEALDRFMFDYDTYGYQDNLEIGQEDMVNDIYVMLCDREQAEGILSELKEIYEEGKRSFSVKEGALVSSLVSTVNDIVRSFPEKRTVLEDQIAFAEEQKGKEPAEEAQLTPEVSEP